MKDALRKVIRPAVKQLRTSANKAGYDIVRIPQSGSNSEGAPEVYFNSIQDKGDVKYIEPVSLRNLIDPDEKTTNRYMSLFLGRIGNIDSRYNFPILGQGDKSTSVKERVVSYVSRERVSQYVSVLDWCMRCGIDLDGGKIIVTVPDGRRDQMESMSFIQETGSYGGHVNFWSIESWFSFLQNAFLPAKIWVGCKSGSNLFACVEPTGRSR